MNATSWPQTQHEEQQNGLWEESFSNRDRTEDNSLIVIVIQELNIFEEIIKRAPVVHSKVGYDI